MPFNIGDFLKKFKNFVPLEKTIKDTLVEIVQEETGILLPKESVSVHNNVIFIHTTPAIKNELFMRKQRLLFEMKKRIGNNSPQDLR